MQTYALYAGPQPVQVIERSKLPERRLRARRRR